MPKPSVIYLTINVSAKAENLRKVESVAKKIPFVYIESILSRKPWTGNRSMVAFVRTKGSTLCVGTDAEIVIELTN